MKFDNLSEQPSCMVFDATSNLRKKILKISSLSSFKTKFYQKLKAKDGFQVYTNSDELTQGCGELTILCGRALLHGVAKYPYRSKYVMIHISIFNLYFYACMIGLIRRFYLGLRNENAKVSLSKIMIAKGIVPSFFICLKNPNARNTYHYSINAEIGYAGFLNYLKSTKKKYVVLRFFENLPNGARAGGDLDILVEDSLEDEAAKFLMKNPGTHMVDMYSVSGPSDAARIPYHTPFLSRQILDNSVLFNSYSVPNDEDYLNSFIYHCLYHKGLSSGIPSEYEELKVSSSPDNDYLAKIGELSAKLDISVGRTLEELDGYMESVGWKPHEDTLELLSSSNKWISRHLESRVLEKNAVRLCAEEWISRK